MHKIEKHGYSETATLRLYKEAGYQKALYLAGCPGVRKEVNKD